MTIITCFFLSFVVGAFVGAWRASHDIAVCRDCLRKLPVEVIENESEVGS